MLPPSAAHVVVTDIDAPDLDGADSHHLFRVLRLRPGETVTLTDGRGAWREKKVTAGSSLSAEGAVVRRDRPRPAVTVGFALSKGDKPEWVVQKLTELGVDRIVLFGSTRSVVHWDASKKARNQERLAAVAKAAVSQSRRVWLPEVTIMDGYRAALEGIGPCAVADMAAVDPPTLERPAILVGPEGGWDEEERRLAPATVRLGDATLRAETAALAAGCILTALREVIVVERRSAGRLEYDR